MTKALYQTIGIPSLILLIATALIAFGSVFAVAEERAETPNTTKTVVLVHGAFADGSSWSKIIPLLQAKGLKVVAVQNPLTSLGDDVAFARRAIEAQPGPVVLVGHSWAGSVITVAGDNDKVKALVYVAAFAPSPGEASVDGIKDFPMSIGIQNPRIDAEGFITLSDEAIAAYFAQDLTAAEAGLIAATQGAIQQKSFEEKLTVAAWQAKPSWYIVAGRDLMIQPDAQRALAKKINAKVTLLPSDHVPMLSRPDDVAKVIIEAADSIK